MVEYVCGAQNGESHSGRKVVPAVGEHAGHKTFSQESNSCKENSVDGDENNAADALVSVRRAENQRGECDA